tara:strand:- start:4654 stop:5022 length:369 start_codon:yes stop_codon:yes gene_type:complete
MFEGIKSIISVFIGILLIVLGGVPLLNSVGLISFSIPALPQIILLIILTVAGYYLFIDGIFEFAIAPGLAWFSMGFGLLSGTGGLLKLLNILSNVLGFIQGTVINLLFLVIGILLVIGAFMF